jgi:hypothetical protein
MIERMHIPGTHLIAAHCEIVHLSGRRVVS